MSSSLEFNAEAYIEAHRDILRETEGTGGGSTSHALLEALVGVEADIDTWVYQLGKLATDSEQSKPTEDDASFFDTIHRFSRASDRSARRGLQYPQFVDLPSDRQELVVSELFQQLADTAGLLELPLSSHNASKVLIRHHPEEILELLYEYEDTFSMSDLRVAIISNNVNPARFLERCKEQIEVLTSEFSDRFEPGQIRKAVLSHRTDPRGFLEKSEEAIAELSIEFASDFSPIDIRKVVINSSPATARTSLQRIRKNMDTLLGEFAEKFTPGEIKQIAMSVMKDPATTLRQVAENIELIAESFGDKFEASQIRHVALNNREDPIGFLERVEAAIEQLKPKYSDILSDSEIREIAIKNPSTTKRPNNTEDAIKKSLEALAELTAKYGGFFNPYEIRRAAFEYRNNMDTFLNDALETVRTLLPEFGHVFTEADIRIAAIGHPKDTRSFLENAEKEIPDLKAYYGDRVPLWLIHEAVLKSPRDSKAYIDNRMGFSTQDS